MSVRHPAREPGDATYPTERGPMNERDVKRLLPSAEKAPVENWLDGVLIGITLGKEFTPKQLAAILVPKEDR